MDEQLSLPGPASTELEKVYLKEIERLNKDLRSLSAAYVAKSQECKKLKKEVGELTLRLKQEPLFL